MTGSPTAQANTGLSPEWDRWFDEAFADLVSHDEDLVRTEFDALINASWRQPPPPPAPPAPSATPADPTPERRQDHRTSTRHHVTEHHPAPSGDQPRSPP